MTGEDRDFCGLSADSGNVVKPVWMSYAEPAKRVKKSVLLAWW